MVGARSAHNRDFKVLQSSAMQKNHPYAEEMFTDREYAVARHSRKRGNKFPLSFFQVKLASF
jgi:hypothetical protein